MHGDDDFDTAQMLKRLQRQVSRLRGGGTEDSVTIVLITTDTVACTDTLTASTSDSSRFAWSEDRWGRATW